PENTLLSFRTAIELGVDAVECDVRLTKDGRLILMHDETVDRTTNGSGRVSELTFEEIRALDAGKGEKVPTLEELLDLVKDKVELLLELKGEGTADEAVRSVEERGMGDQVLFISFSVERLRRVKELKPGYQVAPIFGEPPPPEEACRIAQEIGARGVNVNHAYLTEELVEEAHKRGLEVIVWTPNTEEEIGAAIEKGVDAITSDRPDLLLKLLGRG
ncbi:glycerophosphodiester phosphodiesterase, partial [Candidatus Poribacteria bacterium]